MSYSPRKLAQKTRAEIEQILEQQNMLPQKEGITPLKIYKMRATEEVGIWYDEDGCCLTRKLVCSEGSYWLSEEKFNRIGRPVEVTIETLRHPYIANANGRKVVL